MSILVSAERTPDGWILRTADEFKDQLSDAIPDWADVETFAKENGLSVSKPKIQLTAVDIKTGHLFHAGQYWYKMLTPGARECIVEPVGKDKTPVKLPGNTRVIEISVLSLK
jgi:hypothetical protein